MADFKPKKLDLTQINGGKEYEDRQGIHPIAINAPIEASAWVQQLVETQPDISEANNVGTPSVSIEYDTNGYPYFKFANLKGETGTAEGESFLTKTEADETYIPKFTGSQTGKVIYKCADIADANKTNYIALHTDGTFGYSRVNSSGGYTVALLGASKATITAQSNGYQPIVSSRVSDAVVVGLTANKNTLTDEQKAAVMAWLGIGKTYCHLITLTCQNGYARLTVYNKSAVQFTRDTLKEYLAQVGAHSSNHWSGVVQSGVIYPASGCLNRSGVDNDNGYYVVFGVHWDSYDSNNSAIRITGGRPDALYGEMATDIEDTVTEI